MAESEGLLVESKGGPHDGPPTCFLCLQSNDPLHSLPCDNCKNASARWHLDCGFRYAVSEFPAYVREGTQPGTQTERMIKCPMCMQTKLAVTLTYLGVAKRPIICIDRIVRWVRSLVGFLIANTLNLFMLFPTTIIFTFLILDLHLATGKLQLFAVWVSESLSMSHLLERDEPMFNPRDRYVPVGLLLRIAVALICFVLRLVLSSQAGQLASILVGTVGAALVYSFVWVIADWMAEPPTQQATLTL